MDTMDAIDDMQSLFSKLRMTRVYKGDILET